VNVVREVKVVLREWLVRLAWLESLDHLVFRDHLENLASLAVRAPRGTVVWSDCKGCLDQRVHRAIRVHLEMMDTTESLVSQDLKDLLGVMENPELQVSWVHPVQEECLEKREREALEEREEWLVLLDHLGRVQVMMRLHWPP
jgi:hypothetical protein